MSELEIIDMHCHLQRDAEHGQEMRDYFLTPHLVKPGAPNLGTLDEFKELMAATGISAMNALMFTWSGRYLRHGLYTLPDDPEERAAGETDLRRRILRRISDNNDWAASIAREHPEVGYFAGVNPVVMGPEAALAEIEGQRAKGTLGVKIVPSDMGVTGSDPRLFPIYEYCIEHDVPVLTETGGHSPNCRPGGFADALAKFPALKLVFAHFGHDKEFGGPLDREVLDLTRAYENVHTDTSLRLHEVGDGSVEPEDMVKHLRALGTDRVMFGTNYVFSDLLPERPAHKPAPADVDPRFTQVWKSVQVLKTLPLTDDERAGIAAGNFKRLTGFRLPAAR
ncbi:amidohydrolase family protein [Actinomadura rudentiformis]|uniref:Amidohydrolase family protein n=1 Tax=Actinomadura rudentiformis TaxID=359158 RepID=A0A6H9Y945_9ACTN|nr:amidohydrolase family protein [Actinomadura rudentiformis]KAB2341544.1 amidohydrolase family protein [Actinomadura rudentiformis]